MAHLRKTEIIQGKQQTLEEETIGRWKKPTNLARHQ
jgi:hypothetical protein